VPLYDKTLQTVLGERPCRVIVVSDRERSAGAPAPAWPRIADDAPSGSTTARSAPSRSSSSRSAW
jgi:hypothetical protein